MAVSLFDTIRPIALFGGLGAACGNASSHGVGLFGYALTIFGSLIVGVFVFWLSQIVAAHWRPQQHVELAYMTLYVAVFFAILLASFAGGYAMLRLTLAV